MRSIGASRSQNASRATRGGDLGPDAEWDDRFVGDQEAAGLVHRVEDRSQVERCDRPEVDHLDGDAFTLQGLGGGERLVGHPRHRDDCDVGARTHHGGPANREDVSGWRLRALHAVEQPVLDEDDGVRVADRGAQESVGVCRCRRHDHAQARDVGEQGLEALRVLTSRGASGAELGPHRQCHLGRPAGHERHLGRLVEQLVEADADEVEVHEFHHRAHPGHGGADSQAHDGGLGDGSVPDAIAKSIVQTPGKPEHVSTRSHVDAGDEHPIVSGELGFEGGPDGIHGAKDGCVFARLGPDRRAPGGGGARTASAWPETGRPGRRADSTASSSSWATDDSSELMTSSATPADRSRRAWMRRGSRPSQSLTSSGDR